MYRSTEEAIGALFLSQFWGMVKQCDVTIVASVMWADDLTPDQAYQKFPNQFKAGEE